MANNTFFILNVINYGVFFLGERKIKMNFVEKWLLTLEGKKLSILPKEVTIHAPLNRLLDTVGLYSIMFVHIDDIVYAITYDSSEIIGNITKILVTKFTKTYNGQKMTNLELSDYGNIKIIANKFMANYNEFEEFVKYIS